MFKKVPKVAGLRYISSDLGRDSVYSNEMHSEIVTIRNSNECWYYFQKDKIIIEIKSSFKILLLCNQSRPKTILIPKK